MSAEPQVVETLEDEVAAIYVQRLYGEWTPADHARHEERLARDPAYAKQFHLAGKYWGALEVHAETPEGMAHREEAISYARREQARRWLKPHRLDYSRARLAAGLVGIAVVAGLVWQFSPYGYRPGQYRTDIGEQRVVELKDHSQVAIDAATRLQVRFTDDARIVRLDQGQAQFTVAKDPARPFKVQVGDHVIIALGTGFTVDYTNGKLSIAMVDGKVVVLSDKSSAPIEMTARQQLRIDVTGRTTLASDIDLATALAWRQGKVVFQAEPVRDAALRMRRYSALKIEVQDETLARQAISGVFAATDAAGFVAGIQRYYPVTVTHVGADTVTLKMKETGE